MVIDKCTSTKQNQNLKHKTDVVNFKQLSN